MTPVLRLAAPALALLLAAAAPLVAAGQGFDEARAAYRDGDYDVAYLAFRKLAAQGHHEAQASLGDMYRKGYGVTQDDGQAVAWYRRAADGGSAHAQENLGLMYRDGLGVSADPERAYMWFELAFRNFPDFRSGRRERAARYRDVVAESLDPQALSRARRMAAEWSPGAETARPPPASPAADGGVAPDRIGSPVAIVLIAVALAAVFFLCFRSYTRRRQVELVPDGPHASGSHARPLLPEVGSIVSGKAYVTDGDGLKVKGYRIRFAQLDAPELDQWAKHADGYWIQHGKRVKHELKKAIGGKHVRVAVEDYDQYDRLVGKVTCNDKDVGEWLVRKGHAVAAYGDRYKDLERIARREKRGMWGHAVVWHPKEWRRRNRQSG